MRANYLLPLLTLVLLLCCTQAVAQNTASCSYDFLETFDQPFVHCDGSGGLSYSCFSRYDCSGPDGWYSTPQALPAYNQNDGTAAFSVGNDALGTNWLTIKPKSIGGMYHRGPGDPGYDTYENVWFKTLTVPANRGGRFTVDVPAASQPPLYATIEATANNLSYNADSYIFIPTVESIPNRSDVKRLVFTIPDAPVHLPTGQDLYWANGQLTLHLRARQYIGQVSQNCSDSPTGTANNPPCLVQVTAIPYLKLDNIAFISNYRTPNFSETFDQPFVDCDGSGGVSSACFSRYACSGPYNWFATPQTLPAYDQNDGTGAFNVSTNALGTNWLTIKPPSIGGLYPRSPSDQPYTNYVNVWFKTLTVPANRGGTFTVDVPTANQPPLYATIEATANNTSYNADRYIFTATVEAIPNRSDVKRLVFTIPDAPIHLPTGQDLYWADGQLTLHLRAGQYIGQVNANCSGSPSPSIPNPSSPGGNNPCAVQVAAVPYLRLDNIGFTSTGTVGPLAIPSAANALICTPGIVQLSVNPTLPGVAYAWYSSSSFATPIAIGPTAAVSVAGNATYYVQALPSTSLGCPSDYQTVTVTMAAPLAAPVVSAETVCPGKTTAVNMVVTSTATGITYKWYADAGGTVPLPVGSISADTKSCTVTVSAAATYYVQAIPPGGPNTGCPSAIVPVAVNVQPVVPPTVALPSVITTSNALNLTITGDPTYTYTWDWHDPNAAQSAASTGLTASHTYPQAGTYTLRITYTDKHTPTSCVAYVEYQLVVSDMLCELVLPAAALATLSVQLDKNTSSYLVGTQGCLPTTTAFARLTGPALPGQGEVVAASALSLTPAWPTADPAYGVTAADLAANPYLVGGGRLLPEASYAYATPVLESAAYARSTERGRFQLVPFNWQVGSGFRLPAWRRAGLATRYAPDGQALEERDILRIPSTVKLGYQGHSLPYLTAKNATYGQVLFESFERVGNQLQGEDAFTVDASEAQVESARAHAGTGCLQLLPVGSGQYRLTLPAFTGSWNGDVQLKLWLRVSEGATPEQALGKDKVLAQGTSSTPALTVQWTANLASQRLLRSPLTVVAQTGEWFLCEATLANADIPTTGFTPQVFCTGAGSRRVWVDDVRLQPLAAQLSAYVYDWATLKLLASFDDQHFGLYYQYNAEGKLVRKQVETERGLKTIQETQYNLPQP